MTEAELDYNNEPGLLLVGLLKQIQDGTEAEELLKVLENVMDSYRETIFRKLLEKQATEWLHKLNSVCVALGMLHKNLNEKVVTKRMAEEQLKQQKGE